MRVKYKAWRAGGEDWTGRVVDMAEGEAETLIRCNIVEAVPVEVEVETATITPPENTMVRFTKKDKKKKH